jgi:(p)ppGpp synthase/HD superfamily hydrolase
MVAMEVIAALAHEGGLDGDLAVQCALLHDVVEDASISYEKLTAEFGLAVADGVLALSKNGDFESKHDQMQDSLERIREQPKEIWMVKLADRITNLQPPPGHWGVDKITSYREEGIEILNKLGEGCLYLSVRLRQKIAEYSIMALADGK